MFWLNEQTVKMTEAEWVVREWHDTLMDVGFNQAEALREIEERIPQGSKTENLLKDPDFRAYLLD